MHSTLFELSTEASKLGIDEDTLFDNTDEYLVDYISEPDADFQQAALDALPAGFEYPADQVEVAKETIDGKEYTKVRFMNLNKYLTYREGYLLVFDPECRCTRLFNDWLFDSERDDKGYNTKWYYIGGIFDYHN